MDRAMEVPCPADKVISRPGDGNIMSSNVDRKILNPGISYFTVGQSSTNDDLYIFNLTLNSVCYLEQIFPCDYKPRLNEHWQIKIDMCGSSVTSEPFSLQSEWGEGSRDKKKETFLRHKSVATIRASPEAFSSYLIASKLNMEFATVFQCETTYHGQASIPLEPLSRTSCEKSVIEILPYHHHHPTNCKPELSYTIEIQRFSSFFSSKIFKRGTSDLTNNRVSLMHSGITKIPVSLVRRRTLPAIEILHQKSEELFGDFGGYAVEQLPKLEKENPEELYHTHSIEPPEKSNETKFERRNLGVMEGLVETSPAPNPTNSVVLRLVDFHIRVSEEIAANWHLVASVVSDGNVQDSRLTLVGKPQCDMDAKMCRFTFGSSTEDLLTVPLVLEQPGDQLDVEFQFYPENPSTRSRFSKPVAHSRISVGTDLTPKVGSVGVKKSAQVYMHSRYCGHQTVGKIGYLNYELEFGPVGRASVYSENRPVETVPDSFENAVAVVEMSADLEPPHISERRHQYDDIPNLENETGNAAPTTSEKRQQEYMKAKVHEFHTRADELVQKALKLDAMMESVVTKIRGKQKGGQNKFL